MRSRSVLCGRIARVRWEPSARTPEASEVWAPWGRYSRIDAEYFRPCGCWGRRGPDGADKRGFSEAPSQTGDGIEDSTFEIAASAARRVLRPPRLIGQRLVRGLPKSLEPFVAGFAADAELAACFGNRHLQRNDLVDECETDLRHGEHLPWHNAPPWNRCSLPLKRHLCLFHNCHPCRCDKQAAAALGFHVPKKSPKSPERARRSSGWK